MDHDLQILAVLLKINSFQFASLVVCPDVIIEREMTEASKRNVLVVWRHQIGSTKGRKVWCICEKFNSRWYFALVY